ncbi:MAG TPA: serine hydrolase domain-containing protein [Acidimicrobiales bacterium]|nr:serine hydrolase domain-containing protein [Acidimicrobiales bacterium]
MQALRAVQNWPVGAAAAVVLEGPAPQAGAIGGPAPGSGDGVRIVATVGDETRVLPWASITKLCTALAVLVATEEGSAALDDPAGPAGSTVAHLLAHASGLGPDRGPPLMPPGRRRIYSNYGYELLGEHVGARSGIPFADYLTEAVLEPLVMDGARWGASRSPASGLTGSVRDLAALGRELMSPTLVSPETLARATAVAYPGLDGVVPGFGLQRPCDWGLGPEVRGSKRPHWTGARNDPRTFGHFGRAGGFLWVDPAAGVALGALSDRAFGPWAADAWPALADGVLAELGGG